MLKQEEFLLNEMDTLIYHHMNMYYFVYTCDFFSEEASIFSLVK